MVDSCRDWHGYWIKGFARAIGWTNSLEAKLGAIRMVEIESWKKQLSISTIKKKKNIAITLDLNPYFMYSSLNSCSWIRNWCKSVTNNDDSNADFAPIIDDCRSLMTKISSVKINSCLRKLGLTLKLKLGKGVQLQQDFFYFRLYACGGVPTFDKRHIWLVL